ncbi:hypothetical protein [Rhodococcus sp. Q]|uniref:hypothetical protein n=1 Tax=Rhodococcus sp. Q TaxID=2502252 RepID=UPI0010FA5556|nr:hypothetical protein [Rhodococcus sp. Q]
MKRVAAALFTATLVSVTVAGCTSDSESSDTTVTTTAGVLDRASDAVSSAANAAQGAISSAQGAVSSMQSAAAGLTSRASGAVDAIQSGTFVAAFRAGYPDLSEGRDDAAIEDIYAETCAAIDANVDEATVVSELQVRAGNGGTEATPEQAQQIYNIAKPLC